MGNLEIDPLMKRRGLPWIGGKVVDELGYARVLPCPLEPAPDLAERLLAQVAADKGERVDELDQAVGEHDEQRRRVMQAVAQLLQQAHLVEMHAHAVAVLLALAVQRLKELIVLVFRWRHPMPGLDRVSGVHRAPGIEAVRAELEGEI